MPLVTFKGPASIEDGTGQVEIDDLTLVKDAKDPTDVSDDQLKRLKELPGLRFEVDGKLVEPEEATTAPEQGDAETAAEAKAQEADQPSGLGGRKRKD